MKSNTGRPIRYADEGHIFGATTIATAILDRLLHHSTTINIRGESYRLKEHKKSGLLTPEKIEKTGKVEHKDAIGIR